MKKGMTFGLFAAMGLAMATGLGACSGPSGSATEDGGDAYEPGAGAGAGDGASTSGVGDDDLQGGSAFGDYGDGAPPARLMENRVIYFEYDDSDVGDRYREIVQDHGSFLADNPMVRVRLEGHADERGSREYNIGLGEKRAQSVRQALLIQGVGAGQITTVSYGEERPAVLGSDEESWSLNRRVELVYLQ